MVTRAQREEFTGPEPDEWHEPQTTDPAATMSVKVAVEITAEAVSDAEVLGVEEADLTPRHHVRVGDRVRSYDFPKNLHAYYLVPTMRRYGSACYVEGTVVAIEDHPGSPCKAYRIEVDRRVWGGEEKPVEDGKVATPPVNGTPEWTGGVTFGVFRLDD